MRHRLTAAAVAVTAATSTIANVAFVYRQPVISTVRLGAAVLSSVFYWYTVIWYLASQWYSFAWTLIVIPLFSSVAVATTNLTASTFGQLYQSYLDRVQLLGTSSKSIWIRIPCLFVQAILLLLLLLFGVMMQGPTLLLESQALQYWIAWRKATFAHGANSTQQSSAAKVAGSQQAQHAANQLRAVNFATMVVLVSADNAALL